MTGSSFSMTRDMGVDAIHHLQIHPRRGESVIARGEATLFPDRYAFRPAARRTLVELGCLGSCSWTSRFADVIAERRAERPGA